MTQEDNQKIDFASVFPAKGDPRRPPDWWGRGLLYVAIAIFLAVFVWHAWGAVEFVVFDVVISIFIALAMEPLVVKLVGHGWKRGLASATSLTGLCILVVALLGLFGNMFVQQVISMVKGAPALYSQIVETVEQHTSFKMPEIQNLGGEIFKNLQTSWVTDFAGQALSTTMGLFSFLLNLLTVLMVTYYISAAGPKMRRSLCQWLGPATQRRFLLAWTIVQDQISGFLFSRSILAVLNAFFMAIFLEMIHVPYWLPLALFCGITSQFVPTVGTYIGGALPVVFAWGSNGLTYALAVLVYIIIYQQIENMILSPKISQRTMDLNPAIAFLSVLVLGAVFGALGAFLALPVTASIQAIFKVYTKRYELVDSPLMYDPAPVKKSKVVEGAEAFSEHVIKPVSDHIPRAAKGSSARVPSSDEFRELRNALYRTSTSQDLDESETVAIPKGILAERHGKPSLKGVQRNRADSEAGEAKGPSSAGPGSDGSEAGGAGQAESDSGKPREFKPKSSRQHNPQAKRDNDNPRSRWQ
ncbi:AI-2E family transporter [Bifidobacterium aemilianum]|uniref:AI-2E family transporter n=1 Tax=Bifidobacterium aemilianum TaxID=2493120 RepID=A0A366K6V2_9BIFI|nr:AI-2E family transporter [Bifidobacterium aemilianum]RBP97384.1 AI-2E family transporter [Bifidobacterium aemilianum]